MPFGRVCEKLELSSIARVRAPLFKLLSKERGESPLLARSALTRFKKSSAPELEASPLGFGFVVGVGVFSFGTGVGVFSLGAGVAVAFGFGVSVALEGAFVGALVGSLDGAFVGLLGAFVAPDGGVVSSPGTDVESDGSPRLDPAFESAGKSSVVELSEVSVSVADVSELASVSDVVVIVVSLSSVAAVAEEESARVGSLSSLLLCFAQEDMAKTEMITTKAMVSIKGVFLSEVVCFFI